MTATRTSSGGRYYGTAVELREMARTARGSYPEQLAQAEEESSLLGSQQKFAHASNLILQAVGFEIAAALCCVAQAIEDAR